jgi:hypothetical protein
LHEFRRFRSERFNGTIGVFRLWSVDADESHPVTAFEDQRVAIDDAFNFVLLRRLKVELSRCVFGEEGARQQNQRDDDHQPD